METTPGAIEELENEFKQELWKNHQTELQKKRGEEDLPMDPINVRTIPTDLLINEKINAKLFQFKLKRMGIALSLWEVFCLFEHLNIKMAKMFFEPQRCHHIMFGNFYTFIKNEEYNRVTASAPQQRSEGRLGAPADRSSHRESNRDRDHSGQKRGNSRNMSNSRNQSKQDSRHAEGSKVYNIEEHGYNYDKNDSQNDLGNQED